MTHLAKGVAAHAAFAAAAIDGLSARPKAIAPVWFYDAQGSALFEQITDLPEYYPTRTEIAILAAQAPAMVANIGPGAAVIELGSGSSRKTPLLLQALAAPWLYAPVDVSVDALYAAAARIRAQFPALEVRPIVGDFMRELALPAGVLDLERPRLGFFPGSTIGNFAPAEAQALLARVRRVLGAGAHFILGADAPKDPARLIAAYDDASGVTAAFNKNLLARMNRELDADIDLDRFRHEARWNATWSRMEMHLVSVADQTVTVAGRRFRFAAGETIHTENSHKFTPQAVAALAEAAGWSVRARWCDAHGDFFVYRLTAA